MIIERRRRTVPRYPVGYIRYEPVPEEDRIGDEFRRDRRDAARLSVIPIGTGGITISEADMRHLERMRAKRGA